MFLPGRLQQVRKIIDRLQDLEISFVVRKITPNVAMDWLLPYTSENNSLKNRVLLPVNLQSEKRQLHKIATDKARETSLVDFYSPEELDFLASINAQSNWNNCGVWWDNGSYTEVNTDYLIANDKTRFIGWTCYAGVDCIFIDFDGQIYRAMCQNNGAIGHIREKRIFLSVPTTCKKQWCLCNVDICTRKTKDTHFQQING
jgi:hypothetical protein